MGYSSWGRTSQTPLSDETTITTICNRVLLSHEKNEIKPFAAIWMDVEMTILREVNQRQIPCDITSMWNLKTEYK